MKRILLLSFAAAFIFFAGTGYLWSDDYFFQTLLKENNITTPAEAFEYTKQNTTNPDDRKPVGGLTARYMLTVRKNLWCDEGAIVLATLNNQLGYQTRLVDVIGDDGDAYHTYLEVFHDEKWVTYDTTRRKSGLTHDEILHEYRKLGYSLKGYPRPRPFPKLYNHIIQSNYYLKTIAVWLRGTPG